MNITVTTVLTGSIHSAIDDSFRDRFKPESLHAWSFETREATIKDELAASREVTALGLIAQNGASDREGVHLCKGASLLKSTLVSGERTLFTGEVLTINKLTVDELPKAVVREWYLRSQNPTMAEEQEALADADEDEAPASGNAETAESKPSSKQRLKTGKTTPKPAV